jgi:hypothetical protein
VWGVLGRLAKPGLSFLGLFAVLLAASGPGERESASGEGVGSLET